MCEVSSVGAHQRTRGCSPRGLGGVFAFVQGLCASLCLVALLRRPSNVFFSRHRQSFQPASALLARRSGVLLNHLAGAAGLAKHGERYNQRLSTYSRVRSKPWCARSPRAQACVKAFRGTLDFDYDPRRPSAGRRGEAHHATHARAASYSCFIELLAGSSSRCPCPVR